MYRNVKRTCRVLFWHMIPIILWRSRCRSRGCCLSFLSARRQVCSSTSFPFHRWTLSKQYWSRMDAIHLLSLITTRLCGRLEPPVEELMKDSGAPRLRWATASRIVKNPYDNDIHVLQDVLRLFIKGRERSFTSILIKKNVHWHGNKMVFFKGTLLHSVVTNIILVVQQSLVCKSMFMLNLATLWLVKGDYPTLWHFCFNCQLTIQGGFNAGDGIRFFVIDGSRTNDILNLTYTTNVARPGQWMFRTDEASVEAGGCNSKGR